MATRTKLVSKTGVSSTAFDDITPALTPPNGLVWTLVEFSASFGPIAAIIEGQARIKFDEEIYHEIDSAIHNTAGAKRQKNREIVAIDVIQPHKLQVQAKGDAAGLAFDMQLTVEEAAATA